MVFGRQEIINGPAALPVPAANVTGWFMEHEGERGLIYTERLAVEAYYIHIGDLLTGSRRLAVHAYALGCNRGIGGAPGHAGGLSNKFVEAHDSRVLGDSLQGNLTGILPRLDDIAGLWRSGWGFIGRFGRRWVWRGSSLSSRRFDRFTMTVAIG